MARKTIRFPVEPPENREGMGQAHAPAPETAPPPQDGMARLRERRDRALARRLTVQNSITLGTLISREITKATLGKIYGAWRAILPESSYSTAPHILAVSGEKDPVADARLRALLDGEVYTSGGNVNAAMEKWLCSREGGEDDAGGE